MLQVHLYEVELIIIIIKDLQMRTFMLAKLFLLATVWPKVEENHKKLAFIALTTVFQKLKSKNKYVMKNFIEQYLEVNEIHI